MGQGGAAADSYKLLEKLRSTVWRTVRERPGLLKHAPKSIVLEWVRHSGKHLCRASRRFRGDREVDSDARHK